MSGYGANWQTAFEPGPQPEDHPVAAPQPPVTNIRDPFLSSIIEATPEERAKWILHIDTVYDIEASFGFLPLPESVECNYGLDLDMVRSVIGWFGARPQAQRGAALGLLDRYRTEYRASMPRHARNSNYFKEITSQRDHTFKGYCMNVDDFEANRKWYQQMKNKLPGNTTGAGEFPTDGAEQQRLVQRLFKAMLNLDGTIEEPQEQKRRAGETEENLNQRHARTAKEESKIGLPPCLPGWFWSSQVKGLYSCSDYDLELLAWNLLVDIKEAQEGVLNLNIAGKDWTYRQYYSFEARFEETLEAVKTFKTIPYSFMEVSRSRRLAFDPERETKRKVTNKTNNSKKQLDLAAARAAKEAAAGQTARQPAAKTTQKQGGRATTARSAGTVPSRAASIPITSPPATSPGAPNLNQTVSAPSQAVPGPHLTRSTRRSFQDGNRQGGSSSILDNRSDSSGPNRRRRFAEVETADDNITRRPTKRAHVGHAAQPLAPSGYQIPTPQPAAPFHVPTLPATSFNQGRGEMNSLVTQSQDFDAIPVTERDILEARRRCPRRFYHTSDESVAVMIRLAKQAKVNSILTEHGIRTGRKV